MESVAHVEAVVPIGCTASQMTKIQREIKEVNPVEVPPRDRPFFWNRSRQNDEPKRPRSAAPATASKPPQPVRASATPRLMRAALRDTSSYMDTPDSLDVSNSIHANDINTPMRPHRSLLRSDESAMQLDTPI
mmetsp:Transcript_1208/g.1711  ORF Transcript_1208/g.1711 Transcript_1208/m.1711 type:complete len:133 (-) Transcript_1208:136-534(-)